MKIICQAACKDYDNVILTSIFLELFYLPYILVCLLKNADSSFSHASTCVCVSFKWQIVIITSWEATGKTRTFSFKKLGMQNPNQLIPQDLCTFCAATMGTFFPFPYWILISSPNGSARGFLKLWGGTRVIHFRLWWKKDMQLLSLARDFPELRGLRE